MSFSFWWIIINDFSNSQIIDYIEDLAKSHGRYVTPISIGKSYEGRDIVGVRFSTGGADKPILLLDAGIHAREWIAPTTALYAIHQLARNASNIHYFKGIDIVIIPVLNPDGYEFTHLSEKVNARY